MEEQLLMAYRVVEINHIVYIVVFPIPDQKEIENCNYAAVIDQKNHRMISQRIDLLLRSEESYSIFSNFS